MERNATEVKIEPQNDNNRKLIGLLPMFLLIVIVVLRISWSLYKSFGQKTRNPQQRRLYVGSRARPSLGQQEPTIFVSPSNLPPPPKYECMAPPSYEEVVGVHYPNYQIPITQPITNALAQSSSDNTQNTNNRNETATGSNTVVTVTDETRRASVPAVRT